MQKQKLSPGGSVNIRGKKKSPKPISIKKTCKYIKNRKILTRSAERMGRMSAVSHCHNIQYLHSRTIKVSIRMYLIWPISLGRSWWGGCLVMKKFSQRAGYMSCHRKIWIRDISWMCKAFGGRSTLQPFRKGFLKAWFMRVCSMRVECTIC